MSANLLTLRSVAAAICACTAAAGSFASPAQAGAKCDPHGGNVMQTNPAKTIVVTDQRAHGMSRLWACWRPTHRLTLVVATPVRPRTIGSVYAFRGPWMVWGEKSLPRGGQDSMGSLNVRTGRRGPAVNVRTRGPIAEVDGPTAPFIEPLGRMYAGWVVVTKSGRYAWKTFGRSPDGDTVDAIYAPDGHGGNVRLDVGPYESIDILGADRSEVFWLKGKQRHTARLPTDDN